MWEERYHGRGCGREDILGEGVGGDILGEGVGGDIMVEGVGGKISW